MSELSMFPTDAEALRFLQSRGVKITRQAFSHKKISAGMSSEETVLYYLDTTNARRGAAEKPYLVNGTRYSLHSFMAERGLSERQAWRYLTNYYMHLAEQVPC